MNYRPEVDGLRAVAVIPVLFFHAGFSWFSGGFAGVDVFFVVSGYLITGIILGDVAAGRFSIWGFYERRLRRIAPAVIAMCAATIPFAWAWMLPSEFEDYSESLYTTALAASNFHFWQKTDYFASAAELKPLIHTWSLGLEEQFYAVFPLMLIAFRRHRMFAVASVAAVSFLLTLRMGAIAPAANFYLLPTRFWELATGALVAMSAIRLRQGALAELTTAGGLLLVVLSISLLDGARQYPGWYALPPVLGTAMILAVKDHETLAARVLGWRPLVAIGLISYSLYLWHQPLFAFARIRLFGDVPVVLYLALIALTFAIAYASWRWIEQPCRNRALVSNSRIVAGITVACTLLFAFGLTGDLGEGLGRMRGADEQAAQISDRLGINYGLDRACEGKLPLADACKTSSEPEILVWGDSFAMHLVAGLVASNPSVRMVQFTKSVCGPFFGVAPISPPDYPRDWSEKCLEFTEAVKTYVTGTKSLRYAVLASPFDSYVNDNRKLLIGNEVVPSGLQVAREHFIETLDWLRANGITPVVFMPPPVDGSDIGACLARTEWLGLSGERCNFPASAKRNRDRVLALLEGLDVPVIDIADALCDDHLCQARKDDVLIFRDGGHLSYEGSTYLGRKMSFYERIIGAGAED